MLGSTLKNIVLFPKLPYPSTLDVKGERRGRIPLRISVISSVHLSDANGGTKVTWTGVECPLLHPYFSLHFLSLSTTLVISNGGMNPIK